MSDSPRLSNAVTRTLPENRRIVSGVVIMPKVRGQHG